MIPKKPKIKKIRNRKCYKMKVTFMSKLKRYFQNPLQPKKMQPERVQNDSNDSSEAKSKSQKTKILQNKRYQSI